MRVMKDKRIMEKEETVRHEGYEGQIDETELVAFL